MSNIAIYPKGTSDFFSQGLGILSDVISSNLTQTATSSGNVQQQLVVEYPLGGHLVEQLIEGNFIRASTSAVEADYGIYEIDETLKSDDGLITVYASPYANRILRMTFDNGGRFSSFPSVQLALDEARRNITGFPSNFTLTSGISKSVDLSKENYPTFGDFLEALNHAVSGNIKYRLFGIQIYSSLGVDIQTPLRDDMNTSSVKIKTDYSNIINKVIPLLPVHDESGNATQDKRVGTIVTSKYANSFLDYWAGKVIDFETQEEANTYFNRTSADRPVHTVEVEPINTEMAAVELFDIVQLYSSRFDYTDKLRVSERVFDTLTETVTKFSLGSSSVNIVNSIIDQSSETLATAIRETISLISANGKGIDSWGAVPPTNPHEGDTWFFDDGVNSGVKTFVNGDWVLLVDLATPENIRTAVVKSLEDARTTSEQIAADLDTKIQGQLTTVNGAMQTINGNLTTLDGKAQAYANKALSDAKADTLTQVSNAISTAHKELEDAKIALNKSITDEVSARSNAVSTLDNKAQAYANTAKADAIAAATSADGIVNKRIDDTADSIKSVISQNKIDTDGNIATAQSTATQALNGLTTKVDTTVYNQKTNQLQTDLNSTTTAANTATTEIASIKSDNTKRDARIFTIEQTAEGQKTTISNLTTELGRTNGSVATLISRADGFEATVTKVNNLQIGGTNLIPLGNIVTAWSTQISYDSTNDIRTITIGNGAGGYWGGGLQNNAVTKHEIPWGQSYTYSVEIKPSVEGLTWNTDVNTFPYGDASWNGNDNDNTSLRSGNSSMGGGSGTNLIPNVWNKVWVTFVNSDSRNINKVSLYDNSTIGVINKTGNTVTVLFRHFKGESGNLPTDWSPAPEDVDSATARAQLTADNASLAISNYKTDADGRISQAQADITATAEEIKTKVSLTDYNSKTADLTTKVNTAQSTADGAVTTIGSYKTSNDGRVASAESKISQNTSAIALRVLKTDYDSNNNTINGKFTTISSDINTITSSITETNAKVNDLQQVNLVMNSDMSLDYSGWHKLDPWGVSVTTQLTNNGIADNSGAMYVWHDTSTRGGDWIYSEPVPITGGQVFSASLFAAMPSKPTSGVPLALYIKTYSSSKVLVDSWGYNIPLADLTNVFKEFKIENNTSSSSARYVSFVYAWNAAGNISFGKPMLVMGSKVGTYVSGKYINNDKIAAQQITIDSITNIVSNPTTGLSTRVQTAEGTISKVTGADIPNLQKATFWQPYSSLDLDTYTKQGSFFFASTDTKLHGPTSMTNWMYLVVEQGTSDSGRVVQTVWYDTSYEAKITYRRIFNGAWSPWYANDNDSVTTISQTNEAIRTEISNRQTGDDNTLTLAKNFTTSSISNSESGMKSLVTQTSDAILGKVGAVNLFPNSEFEKDYGYSRLNGNTTLSLITKNDVDGHINGTFSVTSTAEDWQGYWARNIPVYGGHSYSASVLVHYTNGGLSNGKALLDIWFVDKDGNRISLGWSNTADTGQLSTPWWVKLYVENVIAPTNAVNMQVSLIVNSAGAGQTAVFTQPMVTATEKLQPYTPNNDITTQIALLKDNWYIGITSNTGAIASGIAADANAMNIVSPKVIISSPQTQITGTAWIKTAMIADGQISTAKIGDASITSAKILNLDVDKITGNISNWILSQWTSATGNQVTIDGNGLYFSPGTSRMTTHGFESWRLDSGAYKAMGLLGSYAWETNQNINGTGLIAKYYDQPHTNQNDPWRNEMWGADTIAIGALAPETGNGWNYVAPFMIFPANGEIGGKYFQGNGDDTIVMSRWMSIYTGLNMRGHSIVNSSGYSLKENFNPVSGLEALDIFDNTEIMTYDYKPDSEDMDSRTLANMQNKVGFVINDNGESPFKTDSRLIRYGNTRDDSVTVGYLMAAVKELNQNIKQLNEEIRQLKGEPAT